MNIKLTIRAEFWDKKPEIEIYLDDVLKDSVIFDTQDSMSFVYNDELVDGSHTLKIIYNNKTTHDTMLDRDGSIMKDALVYVESLEIEDIDIGYLLTSNGQYIPDYPEPWHSQQKTKPDKILHCTTLGWNGTWEFSFSTPVFEWFVENL